MKDWPGKELNLRNLKVGKVAKIGMLGYDKPLKWINSDEGIIVKFPIQLQDLSNRPCDHAWVLKVELDVKGS